MRKKVLSLISVVLVSALILSPCGCLKESKMKGTEPNWIWYENEEWGWKIKYPAGWEVRPVTTEKTIVRFSPPNLKEEPHVPIPLAVDVLFTVSIYRGSGGTVHFTKRTIIENISDFEAKTPKLIEKKLLANEKINLENRSALRATEIYEYSLDNERWKVKAVNICSCMGEEDLLQISFSAPDSESAKWDEIFEYMLESFEFLN